MDTSVQTIVNKFIDEHYSEFLDRLATKIQEASTLPLVDYDALRHQAVLMQYVWEGVHQVQAVKPDTYLEQASTLVTAAVNRANAATQAAEDINSQISAAEAQRVLAETARANAEDARAAAEILRAAAEEARVQAENTRGTNETDRQTQETARQTAESQRSSWFSTFRATVESWYSNENDPNNPGIVQIWNSFKSAADSWISLAQSAWSSFFGATADSEGGVRKIWSTWFSGAQSDYQALNTTMTSNEQTRQSNETARQTAEGLRATAESDRAAAELLRVAAEDDRDDAETLRETAEGNRGTAEGLRNVAESSREDAEDNREDAEALRAAAETQRQTDYSTLMANIAALYQQLLSRASHPAQFGQDGYIYEWDLTTEQYVRTNQFWQKLERFRISKDFASIVAMEAYDPENLPQGEDPLEKFDFVLIKSTVDDPDNSQLYSYMGENTEDDPDFERWHFLGDFSGAQGFEGRTPQFSIGTVVAGNPGTSPEVSITANGTDANGNPCFYINFVIPRGEAGRGIASLVQTKRSAESEGENIWKATLTDGTEVSFVVLNGQRGHQGRAFTYDDLTGAQKMELAGLARDYRLDSEQKTRTIVTGAVTPTSLVLKVPETISLKNKVRQFIKPHLYPSFVPQNVIYQKVSGTSAMVNPSGEIFALGVGESVFWVIPTDNTDLWRQVSINVRGPRMRLTSSRRIRLGNSKTRIV